MTETVSFTVPGKPTPKARARSTRAGGHYTPSTTRTAEANVRAAWFSQVGIQRKPFDGPVDVVVNAYFAVPKSWSKSKKDTTTFHVSKPDIDNIVKLVTDALNGVAYVDDSSVVRVAGTKNYTTNEPSTLVTLTFFSN